MDKKYKSPRISVDTELLSLSILTSSSDGVLEDMPGEIIFDDLT